MRPNESEEEREQVRAQAVYIETWLLSQEVREQGEQREPFLAPSSRGHIKSKSGKRQSSRVKRTGLRFSRQVCEGLKRREIFGKYTA
jgi:hypothetical protein